MTELIIVLILVAVAIYFLWPKTQKKYSTESFKESWKQLLEEKVIFYQQLSENNKERFRSKIIQFLNKIRITGVETSIDDTITMLVASSAVIPIFYFDDWEYTNLHEVLVYSGLVETYQIEEMENKNNILGQVRSFQSKHLLLLSRESLIRGFEDWNGKENVGIHEFVHLIDEADGDVDGVPKIIFPPDLIRPWTNLMYKEIECIEKGKSDINPYGLTNHAEFLAVVGEYFFENPEKFKKKHPELYQILVDAFKQR